MTNRSPNMTQFKILHDRLIDAFESGFFIEAITIEYSILENRITRICEHLKISNKAKESITTKIKKIVDVSIKSIDILTDFISVQPDLLEFIYDRNEIIHNLVKLEFNEEYISSTAINGFELVKLIQSVSTKLKVQ